jgi:hypothetical protein
VRAGGRLTDTERWRLRGPARPAVRRGVYTAIPVAAASLAELELGASVAGAVSTGAVICGFVALDAPARIRWIWQLVAAPVIGLAAAIGVLSGEAGLTAVAAMTAAGFFGGLCVAVSMRLTFAALSVVLALLVAQGLELASGDAGEALLLAGAGSLLQAAFSLAATISDRATEPLDPLGGARRAPAAMSRAVSERSAAFRHAVRWALALGAATAVYRFVDLQGHGYWVPLTVLFVLKPGLDETRERLAMRAAGTVGGLILATALAEALMNAPLATALVLGAAAALAYAMLALEYALFTAAITVFVVVLTDSLGQAPFQTAGERGLATAIGIAIAAAAFAAVPDRGRRAAER